MTAKNRMSISTMLHYYPEKEEPDGERFWTMVILGPFPVNELTFAFSLLSGRSLEVGFDPGELLFHACNFYPLVEPAI